MTRAGAAVVGLLGLAACASGGTGLLRVDALPSEGPFGEPPADRLVRAIQLVAGTERLVCRPGTGGDLLTCSPADLGTRTAQATIHLEPSGSGYRVRLEETSVPFLRDTAGLCALQRRIAQAIDLELGVPSAHPDPRGVCGPEQGE
ncbi:MAG TPA: hypothetical protein VML50_18940 [Anaeromyxobacter sp.]|nr:hypothetical protein [Anaeromyxobacter sp.]